MNSIIINKVSRPVFIVLALIGACKPLLAGPIATQPLSSYVGMWRQTDGPALSSLVRIDAEYDSASEQIVTTGNGWDLSLETGYTFLASDQADELPILYNSETGVVEALVKKPTRAKDALYQFKFIQPSSNLLTVQIRVADQNIVQHFVRVSWQDSQVEFEEQQKLKARSIIRASRNGAQYLCTEREVERIANSWDLLCLEKLIRSNPGIAKNPQVLQKAVNARDTEMVQFLLANGANVNAGYWGWGSALQDAVSAMETGFGAGGHFTIATSFERAELISVLLRAGADIKSEGESQPGSHVLSELLLRSDRIGLVEELIHAGAVAKPAHDSLRSWPFIFAFVGYQQRWGRENGLRLVQDLLSAGGDPNESGPGTNSPLSYAAREADVEVLKLMIAYVGGDHSCLASATAAAQSELSALKASLLEVRNSPVRLNLQVQASLARVEENIRYLQSL